MRIFSLLLFISFLSGCGTTPMVYKSNPVPVEDAPMIIDRMVMTQHRAWKPDNFVMTEHYFGWGFGTYSTGKISSRVVYARTSSTTKDVAERVYYDEIADVKLLDWTRKFKQWYVVTLYRNDGSQIKHVLRTRSLQDAQLLVDALNTYLDSLPSKVRT